MLQFTMPPLTNAEKCKIRRLKLAEEDPECWEKERQRDRERCRQHRKRPKSEQVLQHERLLGLVRQQRYL